MKGLLLILLTACSMLAHSHGGGVDSQGGHVNGQTGKYHCHKEPCYSKFKQTEEATKKAEASGAAFSTLYDRGDWPHWSDFDNDCQDTRAETLIRQSLTNVRFKRGSSCDVVTGEWVDPFSGKTWYKSSDVDVDHIVPLRWAHGHGADQWPTIQKERFANDMENLLTVQGNLNQSKGARGPDEWLPPNKAYWCDYVRQFDGIVKKYGLNYYGPESQAIQSLLSSCDHNSPPVKATFGCSKVC